MTSTLRERRKEQLRDEILVATRRLLEHKGYAAMSMDELAAEVGISKPTLYSYFATKDALVVATIVGEINRLLAMAEPSETATSPAERLVRLLETVVQLQMHEQRDPIRFWMPEIKKLACDNPELMSAIQKLDARISALVHEAIDAGEIDPAFDGPTLVRVFYALVGSIHLRPHATTGVPSRASAAHTIATLFARGTRPT